MSNAMIVAFVLLGTGLRLYQLNSGLWFDEITTLVDSIRTPLSQIVTSYPSNNNHILYSVLANLCCAVFGEHPWSVRLPAVLFGVASIPMLYLVGAAAANRFEALLATAILTVSYHHIWFSQNARGYTTLLFFVLVATYLLIQWLYHRKKLHFITYALVSALGSYTHLTMVFVVLTHAATCVWTLCHEKRTTGELRGFRLPMVAFLLGGLLTLGLYAPLLSDVTAFYFETSQKSPTERVATLGWALLATIQGLQVGFGALGVVLMGGLFFLAGALSYYRQRPSVLCLFILPAPVTLALGVTMGHPIRPRFIFFAMGFVLLIVVRGGFVIGVGLCRRFALRSDPTDLGRALSASLTLVAILFSLRSLPYGYANPKQDYQGAIEFLARTQKSDDVVAAVRRTAAVPLQKYFGKACIRVDTAEQLQAVRSQVDGLLLILTFPAYVEARQPELWRMIRDHCQAIGTFHGTVAGGDITVYRCGSPLPVRDLDEP